MSPGRETPLTQQELRVLRGMIDEHLFRQRRNGYWRNLFGDARVVMLFIGVAASTVLQVVSIFFRHG